MNSTSGSMGHTLALGTSGLGGRWVGDGCGCKGGSMRGCGLRMQGEDVV